MGFPWTLRTTPNAAMAAVVYGSDKFVGVGSGGVITSTDGLSWTARTPAATKTWAGICHGDGKYVAVASDVSPAGMTSADGITWTAQAGTPAYSQDVCWNGSLYIVCGNDTVKIATSPDGVTWTTRLSTTGYNPTAIAVNNTNTMVVMVAQTGEVKSSPDGITWTDRTPPIASQEWTDVCWAVDKFVAVSGHGTIMTSADGITWTERTAAVAQAFRCVTSAPNGLIVACTSAGVGNRAQTSPDGISWTVRTSAADLYWDGAAYGAGLFVVVANSGSTNRVMTAP